MKILFVLENYYPHIGGVETLFKSLCESLAAKGNEVTVFTSRAIKSTARRERVNGVEIIRTSYKNRYLFTFVSIWSLLSLAKKVDHIHTTSYNAAIPARIVAWWHKKTISITFHEVWAKLWFELPYMSIVGAWLHFLFEQFVLRLDFDQFVAVSESTKNMLIKQGIKTQKITRIYNGIDYSEFEDIKTKAKDGFRYCYFGRLGVSKGLDILLDAAPILESKIPNSKLLLIIPKTPQKFYKRIKAKIRDQNLSDHVIEMNHLPFDQLLSEIKAVDVVVVPSYSEGFCFSAVETMAVGTPVVSSGRGALSEVISGKYISMESFTPKALAQAVLEAYKGNWQYRKPKKYRLGDTVKGYQALFDQLSKR